MEFQQYQPDEAIYRLMRLKGELVECHFEIRNEIKTYAINALVICEKKSNRSSHAGYLFKSTVLRQSY